MIICAAIWGSTCPGIGLLGDARATYGGLASKIPKRVREPSRQATDTKNPEKEAKALTSRITKVSSAAELLDLLGKQMQSKILNEYHMTAFMTKLARFKRWNQLRQADANSPAWAQLTVRLQDMLRNDSLSPRSTANVFYALGELYEEMNLHIFQILPQLCKTVRRKAVSMNEQAMSNCLLAAAKLQDACPKALSIVASIANHIKSKVRSMNSQDLANCLWAAAKLQDASPEVLIAVPALAKGIPNRARNMKPQELSNCLWAAAKLKDTSPKVLDAVPALVKCIPDKVKDMTPQALSNCLCAAATLRDASPKVLSAVPALAERMPYEVQGMIPQALRMSSEAARRLGEEELAAKLKAELDRRKR